MLAVAAMALAIPCFAQSGGSTPAAPNTLNIPSDQGIVAKLLTDLDSSKNSVGESVQAETTRDIKRGHDMLLKKGSTLNGKIVKVEPGSRNSPAMIAILFDQVSPKGGAPANLNVVIQALAPAPTVSPDSLQDGRGMAQSNINAAVSGQDKDLGNGGELMATSTGVHGFSGVGLGSGNDNGKQLVVLGTSAGVIKIKKGAQAVFKVPEQ